jgi:hypothetical protein
MLLAALASLMPGTVTSAAGIHAFAVGAIGTMTLAVMIRATLGHTGRELRAAKAGCFVFVAILVAAVARIAEALGVPGDWLIHLAACAWVAAFFGFAVLYGGMLLRPRLLGSAVTPPIPSIERHGAASGLLAFAQRARGRDDLSSAQVSDARQQWSVPCSTKTERD